MRVKAPHAIVIGAGIGGLVSALELAVRGVKVTLLERSPCAGGKMRELEIRGRRIDSGPTVFTMPWVFESIFSDAGSAIADHLELKPAELLARHAWQEGGQLDLYADRERSASAIAALSGKGEARRYQAFCDHAKRVFETLDHPFIRSPKPSPASLVAASGLRGLMDLWRIRPFESLWHRLGQTFRDPRLRNLFARYATYCGSSPLQAPATLMLVAHVEQCGVWHIEGGMQRLAEALVELFELKGGAIHYDAEVSRIDVKDNHADGVTLTNGGSMKADVVIANCDTASMLSGVLGRNVTTAVAESESGQRSLSAVTWSLCGRTSGFELSYHNVFFPDDYPQEFRDIFDHDRLPARPAVYVCAQDRGPDKRTPSGVERLFLIANAPPSGDSDRYHEPDLASFERAAFGLLEDCGLHVEVQPGDCMVTTPADFESRFPGTGGALYGPAAHGWRASFDRPGARSRIGGLYLAGGSVHPGPGVPMVALSGRFAAQAAAADLGLAAEA